MHQLVIIAVAFVFVDSTSSKNVQQEIQSALDPFQASDCGRNPKPDCQELLVEEFNQQLPGLTTKLQIQMILDAAPLQIDDWNTGTPNEQLRIEQFKQKYPGIMNTLKRINIDLDRAKWRATERRMLTLKGAEFPRTSPFYELGNWVSGKIEEICHHIEQAVNENDPTASRKYQALMHGNYQVYLDCDIREGEKQIAWIRLQIHPKDKSIPKFNVLMVTRQYLRDMPVMEQFQIPKPVKRLLTSTN